MRVSLEKCKVGTFYKCHISARSEFFVLWFTPEHIQLIGIGKKNYLIWTFRSNWLSHLWLHKWLNFQKYWHFLCLCNMAMYKSYKHCFDANVMINVYTLHNNRFPLWYLNGILVLSLGTHSSESGERHVFLPFFSGWSHLDR